MHPIIIAGFGRSGTTWVSDIISKTLGGLILFEPDHPCVFSKSKEVLYNSLIETSVFQDQWNLIHSKKDKNKWLLRNHLISDIQPSDHLIEQIWNNSEILGFKCIRWNHAITNLAALSSEKIVYIIRHPLAVVSSLMNRPRFFMDFDWNGHWKMFKERNPLKELDLRQYDKAEKSLKYAVMWSVSNIKAVSDLTSLGLPFWSYEQLYQQPYKTTQELLDFLGYPGAKVHPSYLFYPSMSTLKTFHIEKESTFVKERDASVFWKETIDETQAKKLISVIQTIMSLYPIEQKVFNDLKYLNI